MTIQPFNKAIAFVINNTPRTHAVTVEIMTGYPAMIRFSFLDAQGYLNVSDNLRDLEPETGAICYNGLPYDAVFDLRDLQRRSSLVNSEWPRGYTTYADARAYIAQLLTDNGFHSQVFIRFNGIPVAFSE